MGNLDDDRVAGRRSEPLDDLSKLVDVDGEDGCRPPVTACAGEPLLDALNEEDPVGQPGEQVVVQCVRQLGFSTPLLTDIASHRDRPRRGAGAKCLGGDEQGELDAATGDERELLVPNRLPFRARARGCSPADTDPPSGCRNGSSSEK